MEHPWLFLVKFCEMLGPGPAHFAHEYPHVLYTWLVMLFLIAMGILGGKSIKLIPGKAQNFFEVVVSGIEEFMVDVTGEAPLILREGAISAEEIVAFFKSKGYGD